MYKKRGLDALLIVGNIGRSSTARPNCTPLLPMLPMTLCHLSNKKLHTMAY
jgi:hypothetical protein